MPLSPSQRSLISICDTIYPNTGTIGYLTLLSGDLSQGLSFSVNASTDTITTGSNHKLVSGSKIRFNSTATLPSPLIANTDYYAISTAANQLKVAATLDNAVNVSPTAIDLSSAGTGTLTLDEQQISKTDALAVLLNKEIVHSGWTNRLPISNLGGAIIVSGEARKPQNVISFQNTAGTDIEYRHALILIGGNATNQVGSIPTGAIDLIDTAIATQTIAAGTTKFITINLKMVES